MKTKLILCSLLLGLIYVACEDSVSKVGMGIQPDEDKISVYDTIVMATATTVKVDSVYAKSVNGYLGELYDPSYGNIKSSYMCQYYPAKDFNLDSIIGNEIDSVLLNIFYLSYLGDSLAPMEVTAYPVVKTLDNHYYTNLNPKDYCDMNAPYAKLGFTAVNSNISDSLLEAGHYRRIGISMPKDFGQRFLEEAKRPAPNAFSSVEAFTEFFPGTYLTTTFGTGSMIPVTFSEIYVYYTRNFTIESSEGTDSLIVAPSAAVFGVTKEVIQLNHFENTNDEFLLEPDDEKTYVKSPAGVYTKITIPLKDIIKGIGKKKFSSVKLSLSAYDNDDWEYAFKFPGTGVIETGVSKAELLLIEPDSVKTFFEQQKVADKQTKFTTTFSSTTYSYDFNNIANVVQNAIDKNHEGDLELLLIPVQTSYSIQQSSSNYVEVDYATYNYLRPSGVTLKKGGDHLQVRIVASDLEVNK